MQVSVKLNLLKITRNQKFNRILNIQLTTRCSPAIMAGCLTCNKKQSKPYHRKSSVSRPLNSSSISSWQVACISACWAREYIAHEMALAVVSCPAHKSLWQFYYFELRHPLRCVYMSICVSMHVNEWMPAPTLACFFKHPHSLLIIFSLSFSWLSWHKWFQMYKSKLKCRVYQTFSTSFKGANISTLSSLMNMTIVSVFSWSSRCLLQK